MKDINNIEVIDHEIVKPQEDIIEETRLQCIKCFKPIYEIEECSICNWHTTVNGKELLDLLRNETS